MSGQCLFSVHCNQTKDLLQYYRKHQLLTYPKCSEKKSLITCNPHLLWSVTFWFEETNYPFWANANNVKSDVTTINTGVPQGTLFYPVGFIHHINDLQTSCGHVKYVDALYGKSVHAAATIAHYKQQQPKSRCGRRPVKWHSITIRRMSYASVSRDHS